MDFSYVLQNFRSDAKRRQWHHHPNGNGWVQNTATVANTAYVGVEAIVADHARVLNATRIEDRAQVLDWAGVFHQATVKDDSKIYGSAQARDHVIISDNSCIGEDATITDYAQVENGYIAGKVIIRDKAVVRNITLLGREYIGLGLHTTKPLVISGSSYSLSYYGDNHVKIGCRIHTLEEWARTGLQIAEERGWTYEEVKEYKLYLHLFAARYQPELMEHFV